MGFSTSRCDEFVEVLASKAPVPGGGGASALVGAVGTALGNMVGSLTVGKKKYADVEEEMYALKEKATALQKDFLRLIERDAEVFEPLAKAYGMPRELSLIHISIGSYDREELTELLEDRQFRKLRETMSEMNEVDIAEFIEELEPEKKVLIYRMLPKELAADVFSFLEVDDQEHIINSITDYELGKIVEDLYVDDAVDMLEELPAIVVKRVLQNATPQTRNLINQFLQYPENSAGSIMTAEYILSLIHISPESCGAVL